MKDIVWETIKHKDLCYLQKKQIAELKNQHWAYGIESQLEWIDNNIRCEDFHLLGYINNNEEGRFLCAYLTMQRIQGEINNAKQEFTGIGGVCVSKKYEHSGFGSALIQEANNVIASNKTIGLLLCKDKLVGFYNRNGWELIKPSCVFVEGKEFKFNVMTYRGLKDIRIDKLTIDRSF